jgi:acyl-CoA reductase-like NAD-dependent aldehyde dehydrogenase
MALLRTSGRTTLVAQCAGHSYGGCKQSGISRECSPEGMLDSFSQRKSMAVNLTTPRRME